jgi:Dolichyl-phosphate-mannose-protein mannosyltransferase
MTPRSRLASSSDEPALYNACRGGSLLKPEALKLPRFVLGAMALSFVLQVAAIGILHTYRFRTTDNHFAFGWEMGCIGKAIAEGRGFSDPFCIPTGPSAWEPPVYPYLIALVFKVCGVYTNASAWVLLTINSLFSAFTCVPIYLIAQRTLRSQVARWSAWAWALLPYTWYWSIHWVWDTTISPLVLSCIFLLSLELPEMEGVRGWALFGILWGFAALLNPSLVSFLPFCGLWVWFRRRNRGIPSIAGVAVASLVFALCVSPWLVRNYRTFGKFVFIRDDFGQQLRLGNGPEASGRSMVHEQPNLNPAELERFRTLGELPYAAERSREAKAFIRGNPARFLALNLRRFVYYWSGIPKPDDSWLVAILRGSAFLASSALALWGLARALFRRIPGASLYALLLLSYPAVYYIVYPHARYRHPIEPELLILLVAVLVEYRKDLESATCIVFTN